MDQPLLLTNSDHLNYRAICALVIAHRHVRKTSQRRSSDQLSPPQKLAMLHAQDFKCAECGCELTYRNGRTNATLEHVIKFQYGGENNKHNRILVCGPCNIKRDIEYSIETVERHFGPIDRIMLEYVPVMRFESGEDYLLRHARR